MIKRNVYHGVLIVDCILFLRILSMTDRLFSSADAIRLADDKMRVEKLEKQHG